MQCYHGEKGVELVAIYHCSVKNIGRSSGKSAVASSAYRSAEKLHDEELGKTFDYTSKDNVVYSEIILCQNAPREYQNRETLWNEVQKAEKDKDSRLAREWEVALPNELSLDQAKELTRGFAQSLADEGMCVDYAIHWKDGNHHAHIMGTTRAIKENGEWAPKSRKVYDLDEQGQKIPQIDKKTGLQKVDKQNRKQWKSHKEDFTDWNKSEKVEEWRERWAEHCNRHLEKEQQIDHRSYQRQGIEQIPTIHEGYVARQMEQRGQVSERCQYNRDVRSFNDKLKEFVREIKERVHEQFDRFNTRRMERTSDTGRGTAERNRTVEVRTRARHQVDTRPNERDKQIEGTAQPIQSVSNQAQQREQQTAFRTPVIERRKRKTVETERDVECREPRIIELKTELEKKAREIHDRLAKYRGTVGTVGTAGQYNPRTSEQTISERAREQLRANRGTNASDNELAIRKLQVADTDRRIAELKRNEQSKQAQSRSQGVEEKIHRTSHHVR